MLKDNKVALYTIIRKEAERIVRIWPQTIIPPAISVALYLLIFGNVIGQRVGDISGFPYIEYIIPGLIMNVLIANAFNNTAHSFFLARFNHSIEELLVSPVPNWLIALGYIGGGTIRGLIVGSITFIVSLLFVTLHPVNPVFTVAVALLASALFATLGLINGILANSFDDTSWVSSFIITPLSYLGGVFYSITALPPIWQKFSLFNPILYIVNSFRFGIIGHSNVSPNTAIACLAVFTCISYGTVCWMLNRGIGIKQ